MKPFLHIPKTSGRSIVRNTGAFSVNGVIGGHIPSNFLKEPCQLWTVVRDPVDRIYSLYKYCWRVDNNFDNFLAHLEGERKQWFPKSTKAVNSFRRDIRERAEGRFTAGVYEDTEKGKVLRQMDALMHRFFVEGDTSDVHLYPKLRDVPGINLPCQWDYINNEAGHNIEIVHFNDDQRIAELAGGPRPHINKGDYTKEEKERELTKQRVARIKKLCKADYDNIPCLT